MHLFFNYVRRWNVPGYDGSHNELLGSNDLCCQFASVQQLSSAQEGRSFVMDRK